MRTTEGEIVTGRYSAATIGRTEADPKFTQQEATREGEERSRDAERREGEGEKHVLDLAEELVALKDVAEALTDAVRRLEDAVDDVEVGLLELADELRQQLRPAVGEVVLADDREDLAQLPLDVGRRRAHQVDDPALDPLLFFFKGGGNHA